MSNNARIRLILNLEDARKEIEGIGSGKDGVEIMAPKAVQRAVRIEDIDARAANILKQEILAVGGECAVSWDTLCSKKENTNVLLMGTLKQYKMLIPKLERQPFGLPGLAMEIGAVLRNFDTKSEERTRIMGILNLTPDSFSGDGIYNNLNDAVEQARSMIRDGADIIDVGGESTRPGAEPVSVEEELERVIPVIRELKKTRIPVSIDTYKTEVAKEALKKGASMVNDINGLRSEGMIELIAEHDASVVIMHMQGTPKNMQENPYYKDVIGDIMGFLRERSESGINSGISKDSIIIDPGIGFGKTTEHNLEIINRLMEFRSLGFPILVGASRKSFIGNVLGLPVEERLEGTLAAITVAVMNGADMVRVHDVKAAKRAVQIADAIGNRYMLR